MAGKERTDTVRIEWASHWNKKPAGYRRSRREVIDAFASELRAFYRLARQARLIRRSLFFRTAPGVHWDPVAEKV